MIKITKDEKEAIIKRFPAAVIVRTVKHKSKRHNYSVEELPPIIRYLEEIRREADERVVYDSFRQTT